MRPSSLAIALAVVIAHSPLHAQDWTFENLGFGIWFDMAVESDGTPHIVYTNCTHLELCFGSPMPRYLIHAARPWGLWMYDTLAVDPAGFTPAITLDDTAGVHVAYMDSLFDLQYIYGVSGGPWIKESLPHSTNFFRNEPDIALDDTGGVHVSYNQGERPWYQHRSDTGWTEEQVSFNWADNDIARSSIKVGNDGVVRIAFWIFPNDGALYEKIGSVWTPNLTGGEPGQNPSLALDSSSKAHILYTVSGGVAYATNETGLWTEEILHPDGRYGDIALTDNEVPIAIYPATVPFFDGEFFYDVDLYLSVQVDSFWQRQSLVSYETPAFLGAGWNFRPRLAIDDLDMLHIAYRHPVTDNLFYGHLDVPTAVDPGPFNETGQPRLRVAPNPFNPSTTLYYSVPFAGRARIDVFDVRGKRVRTLLSRDHEAGSYTTVWDGHTDGGAKVSSGFYFVRLESPGGGVTRRAVLLK